MPAKKQDEEREHRIMMEVIVDCYEREETAMGWYYYLEERLNFPFTARCTTQRSISPLKKGEQVEVIGLADEEDCMSEVFVMVEWKETEFGVPLAQLAGVDADERTEEALGDWHYWVGMGYSYG